MVKNISISIYYYPKVTLSSTLRELASDERIKEKFIIEVTIIRQKHEMI